MNRLDYCECPGSSGPTADAGPGTSEVEVRLSPGADGDTELELVHAAAVGEPMFPTYGPGAGGVGWDLHLLALAQFLADGQILDYEEFKTSPEGRKFARQSATAWGQAHLAAGRDPVHVAAAVEALPRSTRRELEQADKALTIVVAM